MDGINSNDDDGSMRTLMLVLATLCLLSIAGLLYLNRAEIFSDLSKYQKQQNIEVVNYSESGNSC